MTAASRQANHRKRMKENGLVDVRVEITEPVREVLRNRAETNKRTMKAEIREAIDKHLAI